MDNRSSANVFFLNVYTEMGLKESNITKWCISLIGFIGESRNKIGETVLLVFAKGVNMYTKFMILDGPFAYNASLGRPWIQ